MVKVIAALLMLLVFAGCATAPMALDDYYAAIIEANGVIIGVVQIDGHLFFIGAMPEPEWTPPVAESTQS